MPNYLPTRFLALLGLIFLSLQLTAQRPEWRERFVLPENAGPIKSPAQFLGYEPGDRFTVYADAVAYFEYLAAQAPDRSELVEYGRTYEDKPLLRLALTSPANRADLENIRRRQLKLVDGAAGFSATERERRLKEQPVITSFSYNIHGNEASSTEAAMQVAYTLLTDPGAEVRETLEKSVVLLFICINPDGRDRYVYWYNGTMRQTGGEEPRDLEHYAPWPNGRTNHYWFDLNRDWVWGVHPESRGHTAEYQRWMPEVHVDYHEQGYDANYFTVPGTTPRNPLIPSSYDIWADTFGRANIAEFNKYGLSYFTRDRFDFYYPSYGSSYPNIMGGIGMLTEQGGIGAGRAVETNDGYVLSLRQRIFDHYTTSLATARAAARNRAALLAYSMDAWTPAKTQTVSGRAAYLVAAEEGGYGTDFVRMLLLNGVRVEETTEPLRTTTALDYRSGRAGKQREFPAGSYLIRTDQPRHLFVTNLLERNIAIDDSVMYDMATWSAPLAYNLDAYALDRLPTVATRPLTEVTETGRVAEVMDAPTYAYLIDWRQRYAPRALAELWRRGYRVRAARAPFTSGGREYAAGSLIVLRGRNLERAETLRTDMREVAELAKVEITAAATGRLSKGDDLASTRNVPVKQPRVALLVEPPFDTYTAGQLYFLFDQETRLPVERIRASVLQQTALPKFGHRYGYADLNDYDVLILPDGGSRLQELFDKAQRDQLMAWVRGGGTIVALEEAAHLFTKKLGMTEIELTGPDDVPDSLTARLSYADREQFFGQRRIPGSALRAPVDVTNPLAFGVKSEVFTLKFGARGLQPGGRLQSVGTYYDDPRELLTAGYASQANLDGLAGKTWAGVYPEGEGRIVLLLDNPHYRMFWRGPSRMVQNAVMLMGGF